MNEQDLGFEFSSEDAEQAVLGALMLDGSAVDMVDFLTVDDFTGMQHKAIASTIFGLAKAGKETDVISVFEELRDKNLLQTAGGMEYLHALAMSIGSAAVIKTHASIVHSKSAKRSISSVLNLCSERLKTDDSMAVVEEVISSLEKISTSTEADAEPVGVNDCLIEVVADIEAKKFGENKNLIPTGIDSIDRFFNGGFERGTVVTIGARPSMGKTALAMTIGASMAKKHSVTVFSMEMSKRDLTRRTLANIANVPLSWMNDKSDGENDSYWAALTAGMEDYSTRKLWIDERSQLSINQIRKTCKKSKRKTGLDVVIVDYLTLMNIPVGAGSNRAQAIGDITNGLKAMAKQLNVVLILLHQLNRGLTDRNDKRPTMADLKDSGAIEQDSDIVLLLHSEEYYAIDDKANHVGHYEMIVDKFRNGEKGIFNMTFRGQYQRFEDWNGKRYQKNAEQYDGGNRKKIFKRAGE